MAYASISKTEKFDMDFEDAEVSHVNAITPPISFQGNISSMAPDVNIYNNFIPIRNTRTISLFFFFYDTRSATAKWRFWIWMMFVSSSSADGSDCPI